MISGLSSLRLCRVAVFVGGIFKVMGEQVKALHENLESLPDFNFDTSSIHFNF